MYYAARISLSLFVFLALGALANAQSFTPPCKPLPRDRSITFCHPDGVTISGTLTLSGWIKDSLPHTSKEYFDGQFAANPPDVFSGGHGRAHDDKIHTITIVVEDSLGTFEKTFSWRESWQLPCAMPSTDRAIAICTPGTEEVGASPVHFAAVARSSVALRFLQVFVDGKGILNSGAGTSNLKLVNQYAYIGLGRHRITFQAKDVNGDTFKKSVFIEVVENP